MHSKKHLSFSAIRSMIADKFAGIMVPIFWTEK